MDAGSTKNNLSHVADDFEESSVEDDQPYQFQYGDQEDMEGDGTAEGTQNQKRSIKKWTPEEVLNPFSIYCV